MAARNDLTGSYRLGRVLIAGMAAFAAFELMELGYSFMIQGFRYPPRLWWHSDVWPIIKGMWAGHLGFEDIWPRYALKRICYAPFVATACYFSAMGALKITKPRSKR